MDNNYTNYNKIAHEALKGAKDMTDWTNNLVKIAKAESEGKKND